MSNSISDSEAVVHNLLNSLYSLCKMAFDEGTILFYLDEDIDKIGYGTVLKDDIITVITKGNVREQLNLISKFFSSWKDGKLNFLAGSCFRDIYDNRKKLKDIIKFNFNLLEKEHNKIPLIHRANGVILYDHLNGSYYFSFDKYSFVHEQRSKNKRINKSKEEIEQWDDANFHLPYFFDPSLSDRELKFLDKNKNKIMNVGERLYNNIHESGTSYTFAKLGYYFNLSKEDMMMLQNEVTKWLLQTHNHSNEEYIRKSFDDCIDDCMTMDLIKTFL
jgi:hypothetical protein